jgi:hypothetical protein
LFLGYEVQGTRYAIMGEASLCRAAAARGPAEAIFRALVGARGSEKKNRRKCKCKCKCRACQMADGQAVATSARPWH